MPPRSIGVDDQAVRVTGTIFAARDPSADKADA